MSVSLRIDNHYEFVGHIGCVLKSQERGCAPGTLRLVRGRIFQAANVYPRTFRPANVHWMFIDEQDNKVDKIQSFKESLLKGTP